jgi:cytochrome P450
VTGATRTGSTSPAGLAVTSGPGTVSTTASAPLARQEGQIAIGALLRRFPGIALNAAPLSLTRRESVIMNRLNALPVRVSS